MVQKISDGKLDPVLMVQWSVLCSAKDMTLDFDHTASCWSKEAVGLFDESYWIEL